MSANRARTAPSAPVASSARPSSAFDHGQHLKTLSSIEGYGPVDWRHAREVRVLMGHTSRERGIMVVTGSPGVGKTFAVARGAEDCEKDASYPAEIAWVELSNTARGRTLLAELYPQITGVEPMRTATMLEMRNELADALTERHRLLVVDEAQHVSKEAMHELRWLMDRPSTDAALVIVGIPEAWGKLAPEMRSRTSRHMTVAPISDDEVAGVLASYHRVFAEAAPALLVYVNRVYARGRFRWWAHFLAIAVPYATSLGTPIDRELVELVVTYLPKGA